MTRRWSLIGLIVALTAALAFVLVDMGSGSGGTGSGKKSPEAAAATPAPKVPLPAGLGWWPADQDTGPVAKDVVGRHDATLKGDASWASGSGRSALMLNGTSSYADTGAPIIDTSRDYSVAARVRLDAAVAFKTAVSLDGKKNSVFYLQYNGDSKRFSFRLGDIMAIGIAAGEPQIGRWYHLVGTYTHGDGTLRIYVNGRLAGSVMGESKEKPTGNIVIGRGKYQGKPVDYWLGAIRDVHVYGRGLTPAEVASLAAHEPARP
ncbi:LamG domain-containing protein [Streptomyces sp. NPDC002520]